MVVYLGVLAECPLISIFTLLMGTLVAFMGSNQEILPSMLPVAEIVAVPLTSKMLIKDVGSCVWAGGAGAVAAGAAQEIKTSTMSRNSFVYFNCNVLHGDLFSRLWPENKSP